MRIHPDRQTLILAGEPLPRRNSATSGTAAVAGRSNASPRSTYVSGRFDALATDAEVTDAEYTPSTEVAGTDVVAYQKADVGSNAELPATTPRSSLASSRAYSSYAFSSRASGSGASAYARTQDLSERHPIIDTYA